MDAHTCNHPLVPHTVWWMPTDGGPPIPMERGFDNLEDAHRFADKIIRGNSDRMSWLKIFRSDNESYTCYHWESPRKESPVETQKVKLEVDMEPLKEAFDNVALGFKDQGRAINRLKISQLLISLVVAADALAHLIASF